jgi:undecaprenyl-diphosphatase
MGSNLLFFIKAIVIGIVEGITEFLPVSSTGHMILVGHFIDFTGPFATLFEIVIQLGAILAIVVLYRKKILDSLRHLKPGDTGFRFWGAVAIAFIPSGILGLFFHDAIEQYMMFPVPVALALVAGGIWMVFAEGRFRKSLVSSDKPAAISQGKTAGSNGPAAMSQGKTAGSDGPTTIFIENSGDLSVTWKQAAIIGLFQCLAIIWPGFSRSASTIIGGWIVGLTTIAAAEFSFFLALPTMVIATGYSLLKMEIHLGAIEWLTLAAGFLTAFAVALFVVDKFIHYLKHKPMKGFAVYRIGVGLLILMLAVFKAL